MSSVFKREKGKRRNEPLGVVDTGGLEDLGEDGDGGVDRVGDDTDAGSGGDLGNSLGKVANDTSVRLCGEPQRLAFEARRSKSGGEDGTHVEEVVTGHSWLAGHSSRDDDNLGTVKSLLEAVVLGGEAEDLGIGGGERQWVRTLPSLGALYDSGKSPSTRLLGGLHSPAPPCTGEISAKAAEPASARWRNRGKHHHRRGGNCTPPTTSYKPTAPMLRAQLASGTPLSVPPRPKRPLPTVVESLHPRSPPLCEKHVEK